MSIGHIDGDPDGLRSSIATMRETTDALDRAAKALRHVADRDGYKSKAVSAASADIEEVIEVMRHAHTRYSFATDALETYESVLRSAQERVEDARAKASTVDVDSSRWQVASAKVDALKADAMGILDPGAVEERSRAHANLSAAKAELHHAQAVTEMAEAAFSSALADVEAAAKVAADLIDIGNGGSTLNDTFGDNLKSFYDRYLAGGVEIFTEVLKVISTILSVVSIIVAFIPGLQLVAAGLKVVSLVTSLAALVLTTVQAMFGAGTWGDVLGASIGVLLSVLAIKVAPGAGNGLLSTVKVDTIDTVAKKVGMDAAKDGVNAVLKTGQGQKFLIKETFASVAAEGKILATTDSVLFHLDPEAHGSDNPMGVVGDGLKLLGSLDDPEELGGVAGDVLGDGYDAVMGDPAFTTDDLDVSLNSNPRVDVDAIFEGAFHQQKHPVLACSGSSDRVGASGLGGGGGGGW
jgi:hypothetical protein